MSKPQITVDVAKDGTVQVSVQGVAGKSCVDATRDLERELGKRTEQKKTRDYHKQDRRVQRGHSA